jgi:hypothetical protein
MEDIKHVNVTLTLQDEKVLSRTAKSGTRKRKSLRSEEEPILKVEPEPKPAPVPTPAPTPVPTPVPAQVQVKAPVPEIKKPEEKPAILDKPIEIKINTKKTEVNKPNIYAKPQIAPLAPKILQTKKRSSLAPSIEKKVKLMIPTSPPQSKKLIEGSLRPVKTLTKRNYTERKISINVKPSASAKKFKQTLKRNISQMPIGVVKKTLLAKGVLKPKKNGSYPLRSMLKDYMSLHTSD